MRRFLIILMLFLGCAEAQSETLPVPGVYQTIQSAINDSNDGDVIIVEPNTYHENINFFGKAITVRSLDPNDANIVSATIIDGNELDDPNYGSVVTFNSGEGNDSVIEGFTITGGSGSWAQIYWEFKGYLWNRCGGGVLCLNSSSPTITRNVFVDNIAGQGGGIYFYNYSDPIVANNTFINNSAIINHGYEDPDVNDSNNYDHGDGGAIVGFQYCDATITNNLIQNNHADYYGGGIHLRQWSNGEISNNQIINNDSTLGAGIHITYTSSPVITDNIIKLNNCTGGGGGIYVYYHSNPLIERNIITLNSDWHSAGIGIHWSSAPTIRNNIIVENTGLGILFSGGNGIIVFNTVSNNYAGISKGGIKYQGTGNPVIENNIITSNENGFGIYADTGSIATISYNNVWGNPAGNYNSTIGDQTGINGNISVDPNFADPQNVDYHLQSESWRWDPNEQQWQQDAMTSRCIDAGNPGYSLTEEPLFVPNDPNCEWSENLRINMGAYGGTSEASLPPYGWALRADITNDGIVDFADLAFLTEHWLETSANNPGDNTHDEIANFPDFAILANDWLKQNSWY